MSGMPSFFQNGAMSNVVVIAATALAALVAELSRVVPVEQNVLRAPLSIIINVSHISLFNC